MSEHVQYHLESIVKSKNGLEARVKDLKCINEFELVPIGDFLTSDIRKEQLKLFEINQMLTLVSLATNNENYNIVEERNSHDKAILFLSIIFCAIVLISNFTSCRLVQIMDFTTTGAMFFPLTYFISNIITEVYGFKKMRFILLITIFANVLFGINIWALTTMDKVVGCAVCNEFDVVAKYVLSITGASIISFLFGTYINSYLIARMKSKLKYSVIRRIFYSVITAIITNSILFVALAFGVKGGLSSIMLALEIIIESMCYEILLLYPTVYFCRYLKNKSQTDIYDFNTNFSLLSLFDTSYTAQHNGWKLIKNHS